MVDTLDLGSNIERCESSTLSGGTLMKYNEKNIKNFIVFKLKNNENGSMAKLVDARDLKSLEKKFLYGFDSRSSYY